MARMDFVMHADVARLEADGVTSMLGGSFRSRVALLNTASQIAIVARIIFEPDDTVADVSIRLVNPAGSATLDLSGTSQRPADVPAGPDGEVSITVLANAPFAVSAYGTYVIEARAGNGPTVTSWFDVIAPQAPLQLT